MMCLSFTHPCPAVHDAIVSFASSRIFGASHYERAAALKALFSDPCRKLIQWELLSNELMEKLLAWAVPQKAFNTALYIECHYASGLFGEATGLLDIDPEPVVEPKPEDYLPDKPKPLPKGASRKPAQRKK